MATLSINYAEKLRSIGKAEKLTQEAFANMVGLSLSIVKAYESGRKKARAEVMEKVLQVNEFKQYTTWLLYDDVSLKCDQIAPNLLNTNKENKVKINRLANGGKEISTQISSQLPDIQAIMTAVSRMNDEEITELANILSRRGTMLLLELLDPDNQLLLNLPEKKKRAALRLESMGEEQFREILSKIEGNTDLPQEEINVFTKKNSRLTCPHFQVIIWRWRLYQTNSVFSSSSVRPVDILIICRSTPLANSCFASW